MVFARDPSPAGQREIHEGPSPSVGTREIASDFDRISPVYDATRDPLDEATLGALVTELRREGVERILEVGVGTGRIARPLTDRGLEVTGIDVSRGMLAHARAKGLPRLLRASAYRLPFADRSFDAALFVHVLHVLEAPERAIAEAVRAGPKGAFAVVHPRPSGADGTRSPDEARRLVREELVKAGYQVPDRGGPAVEERKLLTRLPPSRLVTLSDRTVTVPLARRLDALAARAHRYTLRIPPAALERAIATVRAQVGDRAVTSHRVEALATWSGPVGPRD